MTVYLGISVFVVHVTFAIVHIVLYAVGITMIDFVSLVLDASFHFVAVFWKCCWCFIYIYMNIYYIYIYMNIYIYIYR